MATSSAPSSFAAFLAANQAGTPAAPSLGQAAAPQPARKASKSKSVYQQRYDQATNVIVGTDPFGLNALRLSFLPGDWRKNYENAVAVLINRPRPHKA